MEGANLSQPWFVVAMRGCHHVFHDYRYCVMEHILVITSMTKFFDFEEMHYSLECQEENIAVFSEKTDIPHPPNQSMEAISVMKLRH